MAQQSWDEPEAVDIDPGALGKSRSAEQATVGRTRVDLSVGSKVRL